MKKFVLLVFIFVLNIFVVNAQLAKVYDEENLDFDRDYRDNYLQERNYFSDLNYEIVTGGHSLTAKVGGPYYNDYKAINLNNPKKYVFDLLGCNSYSKYCTFRVNGVPTGKMEDGGAFKLDEEYTMKIENIEFDFCDNRAFCHIGFEAYNIIDFVIDGPSIALCGNGICEAGETCEEDSCCSGKKVDLGGENENCGRCGRKCDPGLMCQNSRCIELCPETNKCDYFKTRGFCSKSKVVGEACDCNEECDSLKCFNGKCISGGGNDLSNYPSFLIRDGNLDVTIVVGDNSASSDVLAQANIGVSLAALGKDVDIKNKLSSEIKDLNLNIISIGNPCNNEVSSEIMNNPKQCDKDFPRGNGYIRLYQDGDFIHLIVAGYSDKGTKEVADILANYDDYNLKENVFAIEVEEDVKSVESAEQELEEAGETKEIEEDEKTVREIQEVGEEKIIDEKETIGQIEEEKSQTSPKETSLIQRIVSWFLSLFGGKK